MNASRWAPSNDDDGFAQTREPDNLFDDDITPIAAPIEQPTPAAEQPQRQFTPNQRARGNFRGRGRGRGARDVDSPRRQDSSTPQSNATSETPAPVPAVSSPTPATLEQPLPDTEELTAHNAPATETQPDASDPTTPSTAQTPKVAAVRGPRHQTGGLTRPKLTEDELSARMAAAALNNAKREAAHREAEADAAKFEAREAAAQHAARQRKVQESAARRVMDTEREKNRQRKIKAQGGREWDVDKDETQLSGGREARRSGYAGPRRDEGESQVEDGLNEDPERGGFRGRGRGRGRGSRGRGRGRGGLDGSTTNGHKGQTVAPSLSEEQFPALSTKTKSSDGKGQTQQTVTSLVSPVGDKGTWADQVEAAE